ncbi:Cytochrome c oxidase subunit 5B [Planoprotostelium fungivorum]|uniref:Cytochrome c oxidase subunit 5B n=1 Tax=Planoprotostelium fungivorum TaxID=1890364 RepID=A0A2P6NFZ2_9EUKA|nr:Cytochrome c oxidase subunit 5B [Planoprotostelium fungivorum]
MASLRQLASPKYLFAQPRVAPLNVARPQMMRSQMRFASAASEPHTSAARSQNVAAAGAATFTETPAQQVGDEYKEKAHPEEFATLEIHGPFGTKDKPVEITSFLGYRVVGCQGGAGQDHETLWHMVKGGKPTICLECGQFFSLKLLKKPGHGHH